MTADEFIERMFAMAEELDYLYQELLTSKLSETDCVRIKLEAASVIYEAKFIQREAEMRAPIAKEVK